MLRIKLVKSPIGNIKSNRLTVAALGLRKMHQTVELPDTPSVRGMVHKVKHMLQVESVEGEAKAKSNAKAKVKTPAAKAEVKAPKAVKPKAEKAAKTEEVEAKPKAKRTTKKADSED